MNVGWPSLRVPLSSLIAGWPGVVLLLACHAILAISGVCNKSVTFDETAHITAGLSYWKTNDYRLQPENGNWPQRWAAIPLAVGGYPFPSRQQASWWGSDVWPLGKQLLYSSGHDADALLLAGRVMIVLVGVVLGLLVYLWARHLFGPGSALISLVLYAFSPTILAHGSLVTSDITAALFFMAATWCLWSVLHRVTPRTVLVSSLVTGGLLLSKFSGVLIIPIGLFMLVLRVAVGRPLSVAWRQPRVVQGRLRQLPFFAGLILIHVLVAWVMIWASFGFRYAAMRDAQPQRDRLLIDWSAILEKPGTVNSAVSTARDERLLPEAYLYGFAYTLFFAKARRTFLNGEFGTEGWTSFFPYCLMVKTPLPLLLILILAAVATVIRWFSKQNGQSRSRWRRIGQGWYETAPLWVLGSVYWAFAITSNLNIGHRHIVPTYPPMFVLAAAAGFWFTAAARRNLSKGTFWAAACAVGLALVLFVVESLLTWPNYLAYFNQLVGGPAHGYKHLVDSSLDWGQDLPGLKTWLDRNGPSENDDQQVYFSYFGSGSPEYYGIRAKALPSFFSVWRPREVEPLCGGIYCLSATMLQGIYLDCPGAWSTAHEQAYQGAKKNLEVFRGTTNPAARDRLLAQTGEAFWWQQFRAYEQLRFARLCSFLRRQPPHDQVGYSILIYRVSDEEIDRALDGPPVELVKPPPKAESPEP